MLVRDSVNQQSWTCDVNTAIINLLYLLVGFQKVDLKLIAAFLYKTSLPQTMCYGKKIKKKHWNRGRAFYQKPKTVKRNTYDTIHLFVFLSKPFLTMNNLFSQTTQALASISSDFQIWKLIPYLLRSYVIIKQVWTSALSLRSVLISKFQIPIIVLTFQPCGLYEECKSKTKEPWIMCI